MTGAVEILLVEDSPGDARLMAEAFEELSTPVSLHVAVDGVEALDFLYRRGAHAGAPRPDLVLLDLNLPRRDGREVLAEVKDDPRLRPIPVLVLSTSRSREDVLRSYRLHANCYLAKPTDLDEFLELVRRIEWFWLALARLA